MGDDLRARMLRTAAGQANPLPDREPPGAPSDPATSQARPRPYPRRVTLDLTEEDHRALRLASVDQRIPMAELLRELVREWRARSEAAGTSRRADHGPAPLSR